MRRRIPTIIEDFPYSKIVDRYSQYKRIVIITYCHQQLLAVSLNLTQFWVLMRHATVIKKWWMVKVMMDQIAVNTRVNLVKIVKVGQVSYFLNKNRTRKPKLSLGYIQIRQHSNKFVK